MSGTTRAGLYCPWRLTLALACGLAVPFATACSKGTDPGLPTDGGVFHIDAHPDAGPGDSGPSCPLRCGPSAVCCNDGEECVADVCRAICAGTRCGDHDELCCAPGDLCIAGRCAAPGRSCTRSTACGMAETCDPVTHTCTPVRDTTCRVTLPSGMFAPEIQWEWTDEDVFATPLVIQLTDDDADGRIDPRDVPDVVVISRLRKGQLIEGKQATRVTALSGDDGHVIWQSPLEEAICYIVSPAAGDVDGDGLNEIVVGAGSYQTITFDGPPHEGAVCGYGSFGLLVLDNEGHVQSRSTVNRYGNPDDAISLADVDGDGATEILLGSGVYNGRAELIWTSRSTSDARGFGYDVDGDGLQEYVSPSHIYPGLGGPASWTNPGDDGYVAVGDVWGGPGPELVVSKWGTIKVIDLETGAVVFGPFLDPSGFAYSGAPTIGDFDADGHAEFGIMMAQSYIVFDWNDGMPEDSYIRWRVPVGDYVASTGSTLFDFDADGAVEVVFNDTCHLQIRNGRTGALIWAAENTSVTLWEYPVVADVDNDGNAEIVTVANDLGDPPAGCAGRPIPFTSPTSYHGVRVFRDRLDHWVQTRTIWNEYNYRIDNVNEDGSIPPRPVRGFGTHNTFRVNAIVDRDTLTLAPDLQVVSLEANASGCTAQISLRARVRNGGAWGVPAGLPVAFYAAGDRHLLGVARTTEAMLSGDTTMAEVTVSSPPIDASDSSVHFYAVVDDDGTGAGDNTECNESNNASPPTAALCRDPI